MIQIKLDRLTSVWEYKANTIAITNPLTVKQAASVLDGMKISDTDSIDVDFKTLESAPISVDKQIALFVNRAQKIAQLIGREVVEVEQRNGCIWGAKLVKAVIKRTAKSIHFCYHCEVGMAKKESYTCRNCQAVSCGKHCGSYVDGNNGAITRNSPTLCFPCYKQVHGSLAA